MEKSDYLATKSAREDKKQKLLFFAKYQRKEPFLLRANLIRCPVAHQMDT